MTVPKDVAGLAISVAAGAIRLGRRIDEILAEEAALRSDLVVPMPPFRHVPTIRQLKEALQRYLDETAQREPDPLSAAERRSLVTLLGQTGARHEIEAAAKRYGVFDSDLATVDLDADFARLLRSRGRAWNLDDADVRCLALYVQAGPDYRSGSLTFRLSTTVLDVLLEIAPGEAAKLVRDPAARRIVASVLQHFAETDLARVDGWKGLLTEALRATVDGLVDARDLLHNDQAWLDTLLAGLARARDLSPERTNFFIGLLRGRGYPYLVRGLLEEGSQALNREDARQIELVFGEVIGAAAGLIEPGSDFESFFHDHWHELASASIRSLERHGPALLGGDDPLLARTLEAAIGALAQGFDAERMPSGDTLVSMVEAAIGVVADDPALLDEAAGEKWLAELLGGIAGLVNETGLRKAFSRTALESYARETLAVLEQHPEVLAQHAGIVQDLLGQVLGATAELESFTLESFGTAVVTAALEAIAADAELLDGPYGQVLGETAGALATYIFERKLSRVQGLEILAVVAEVLAANQELFVKQETTLARVLVAAVLSVDAADELGFLAGRSLSRTLAGFLSVASTRGRSLLEERTVAVLEKELVALLERALGRAAEELGRRLDRANLPLVLTELFDRFARGELDLDELTEEAFSGVFAEIAEQVTRPFTA